MCVVRLQNRLPSAIVKTTGHISGYVLAFHKQSVDGSGKGNIEFTGHKDDLVYGVVFEFDASEKHLLDQAEGLGHGYEATTVRVSTQAGKVETMTYYATHKDHTLKPYHWYKAFVVHGAKENHLPAEYIAKLEAVESIDDPKPERQAQNEAISRRFRTAPISLPTTWTAT
jgi:gamma-glutamylcyclotransferase